MSKMAAKFPESSNNKLSKRDSNMILVSRNRFSGARNQLVILSLNL